MNGEFMSSILHILRLIYPKFTCLDPDPYSADSRNADAL